MNANGPFKKILIVEDTDVVQKILVIIVKKAYPSATIQTSETGKLAMEMISREDPPYDLIITDHNLLDGAMGLQIIEAGRKKCLSTMILMHASTDDVENSRQIVSDAHGDEFLSKPPRLGEFMSTLRTLEKSGRRRIYED